MELYDDTKWERRLNDREKYVYSLILKGHNYYNRQDKKYKIIVQVLKIIVLLLSLFSTIILGVKNVLNETYQVNIGLVLSAIISFTTGVSAYFNFEKYWMRNIKTHIRFNILRDSFVFEMKTTESLKDERLKYYMDELQKIQDENIVYWQKAIEKSE